MIESIIWKIKYSWRYELHKLRERALVWFVWHLPSEVAMRTYVRVGAHATTGKYSNTDVHDLTMMEALERWGK